MNIDADSRMEDLTLIKYLASKNSPFLPKIKEVYDQVKDVLNTRVQHVFPKYTLHNTGHSFRIMEYMSNLVSDYTKLDELEITILIYSALLHDIGMAVSADDISSIKDDSFPFCEVKFSAMKKIMDNNEEVALQEYVRRIHASLSGRFIRENLKEKLTIPRLTTLDFAEELALICESHTQDYDWIKSNLQTNEIRGDYSFNPQFIACILRLADILDIDSNRTPYSLYKLIAPKGLSDDEWKQHFVVSNNEKITFDDSMQRKKIVFHGKAKNAHIHRKILAYIGWVGDELANATTLSNNMLTQYRLLYDIKPDINIQAEGYTFSDYKMTLEFRAISSLLMGEKIYGSRSLGLRELIQNSIDSCRLRQEAEALKYEFGQDKYQSKIRVILDQKKKQVIIKDNGTGMSLDIIKKHFLNIGVSYYNSTDFLLKDLEYKPIGNFGIGFLSCFMLSGEVKVITRYYKSKNKYLIELEKASEWTSLTEIEDVVFDGTEVILNYSDFMEVFGNDPQEVGDFLNQYFLTDGIILELVDKSNKEISKIEKSIVATISDDSLIKIDLQDYLKDIKGYSLIRKKNRFIRKFEELDFTGNLYRYKHNDGLIEVTEFTNLQIDDYLNGDEIKYLVIPLVESPAEDNFLNGMNFTNNDVNAVIEKMHDELTWISVIVPKDYQYLLESKILYEYDDDIFEDLTLEDLIDIGHSSSCPTEISVRSVNLFQGRKNELYLPFQHLSKERFLPWRIASERKELFMRSVLIRDFRFHISTFASVFEINTIRANINSRKFIPDISRNNINAKDASTINYIIGKAIHNGAMDTLVLESDEKETLQKFIKTFYRDQTDFEKLP